MPNSGVLIGYIYVPDTTRAFASARAMRLIVLLATRQTLGVTHLNFGVQKIKDWDIRCLVPCLRWRGSSRGNVGARRDYGLADLVVRNGCAAARI